MSVQKNNNEEITIANHNNIQMQNQNKLSTNTGSSYQLHISSGAINSKQLTLLKCTKISNTSRNRNNDIIIDDQNQSSRDDNGTSISNYNNDSTDRRNIIDHNNIEKK